MQSVLNIARELATDSMIVSYNTLDVVGVLTLYQFFLDYIPPLCLLPSSLLSILPFLPFFSLPPFPSFLPLPPPFPTSIQAIVKEDELMSRLEMLENQLQVYSRVSCNADIVQLGLRVEEKLSRQRHVGATV